ncbi:MAG: UDP-N-acetylmuramate dehydrogenase [Bifidobacteriaceae bacterium]|jgi:UDP-N-acetylmuramate dehydrogenase|nr:UDP-N-acetylmuramate dehydrogenase [Bifidobacteriaceae bacterium]
MPGAELRLASPDLPPNTAVRLAELTTMRMGGVLPQFVDCTTEDQLIAAVAVADQSGDRLLMLGGGSNIVALSRIKNLLAVRDRRGWAEVRYSGGRALLTVAAGASWDAVVAWSVEQNWSALAPLSGIPGSAGALPVQNAGAYGAAAQDVIRRVKAFDRLTGEVVMLDLADLALGYRDSALKRSIARFGGLTPRWVVLDVTLDVGPEPGSSKDDAAVPVTYSQLADVLGVPLGTRLPGSPVRQAVLRIRRSKGMLLDPSDRDTWSVGSYFTNPVVSPEQAASLPPEAPRFEEAGQVKLSAAWLMTQVGIGCGWGIGANPVVTTSTKHVLALTNRGGGSAADVLLLEQVIVGMVHDRFGIQLTREPVLVG